MMFMRLTGLPLWTRLHGPRIAALGTLVVVATGAVAAISPTWVS
jgi:hypothetical protein